MRGITDDDGVKFVFIRHNVILYPSGQKNIKNKINYIVDTPHKLRYTIKWVRRWNTKNLEMKGESKKNYMGQIKSRWNSRINTI